MIIKLTEINFRFFHYSIKITCTLTWAAAGSRRERKQDPNDHTAQECTVGHP